MWRKDVCNAFRRQCGCRNQQQIMQELPPSRLTVSLLLRLADIHAQDVFECIVTSIGE